MKKRWKLALCAILCSAVLCLSACSSKVSEEGFALYKEAFHSLENMKSADLHMKMLIDSDKAGMHMKLDSDASYNAQKKLEFAGNISVAANGMSMDDIMNLYIKNDVVYIDMAGEKFAGDFQNVIDDIKDAMPNPMNTGNKDQFKKLTMEENDKGYLLHLVFSDQTINDMKDQIDDNLFGSEYRVSVHQYTADLQISKDKQLESIVLKVDAEYAFTEQTVPAQITMNLDIQNANQVTSIDFPSLKDFPVQEFDEDEFKKHFENSMQTV